MNKIYESNIERRLRDIIEDASKDGAEVLIPDLQRSYVWRPDQIVLLVDSILRGWPFGSLLTWKYFPDSKVDEANYGIPARGFFRRVARDCGTTDNFSKSYELPSVSSYRNGYTMILDGQQRLQSLILAFCRETRFRISDYNWYASVRPQELPGRRNNHYTSGQLCLNVDSYLAAMKQNGRKCENVPATEYLQWVIADLSECSPRRNNRYPLECAFSSDRHFVPLYLLWEKSKDTDDSEVLNTRALSIIEKVFENLDWLGQEEEREGNIALLGKLLKQLHDVGELRVNCLEIDRCRHLADQIEDPQAWFEEEKSYDDAIVNIFTRLNTAGRALTNQEITYAWLKRGWQKGRNEYRHAADLVNSIKHSFGGLGISDDDAISLLSLIWCVMSGDRHDGRPLERRDFLKGGLISPMARYLSDGNRPEVIAESVKDFAALALEILNGSYLNSFNAVQVAFVYYLSVQTAVNRILGNNHFTTAGVDVFQSKVADLMAEFVGRWLFVSAYSGKWSGGASEFMTQISKILQSKFMELKEKTTEDGVLECALGLSEALLALVIEPALKAIEDTVVWDSNYVSQYRTRLVAWQRMDIDRARFRELTFGDKGGESLQVDHIIPKAGWYDFVDSQIESGKFTKEEALDLFDEYLTEDKQVLLRPENADVALAQARNAAKAFINRIGNCSLLKWRYNGAKSRTNYDDYMANVYEAKKDPEFLMAWANKMCMDEVFLHPFTKESGYKDSKFTIRDFVSAIRKREEVILDDLKRFISGTEGYKKLY